MRPIFKMLVLVLAQIAAASCASVPVPATKGASSPASPEAPEGRLGKLELFPASEALSSPTMGHNIPNVIGVDQSGVEEKIRALAPGYMAMGKDGMAEHAQHSQHMQGLPNTLPMMTGTGPFGPIEMGGMSTVVKVREKLTSYDEDPGWYKYPSGTVAFKSASGPVTGPNEKGA